MSAVRHLQSTKARVIELYAAGWRPKEIQERLRREGVTDPPSLNTIWAWTHPEKASGQAQRNLAVARRWRAERATFHWPGRRSAAWRLERMRRLHRVGLSHADIARVMTHDFPDAPLGEDQVRRALVNGVVPRPLRRLAG